MSVTLLPARLLRGLALSAAVALAPPAAAAARPADVRGAGATFPAPIYAAWAEAYARERGVAVAYEPVGSGAGIERIERGEVDFGATDAPLLPADLAREGLVQFPVVIGGVVPVVNIAGVAPGALRLSGPVLADIYLGRVRRWNAPEIAALNPALRLPDANITVVHRRDASGSTLLWTGYLSRVSDAWEVRVGASLSPRWPTGVGGDGNEGVAAYVQRTRFAIGYVEYAFARAHRLSDVALLNRSGRYVRAQRGAFRAAAAEADWTPPFTRQLPADPPGEESWPIAGASFVLLPAAAKATPRTPLAWAFFDWALRQGERLAGRLDYEPLPRPAAEAVRRLVPAQAGTR